MSRHGRDSGGASLSSSFELLTSFHRGECHGERRENSDTQRLLRNPKQKRSHTFVHVFLQTYASIMRPQDHTTIRPLDSSPEVRNSLRIFQDLDPGAGWRGMSSRPLTSDVSIIRYS